MARKRAGVRDVSLTGVKAIVGKPRPLFREAAQKFDTAATPNRICFVDGPSAAADVVALITGSNMEAGPFAVDFIQKQGLNPKSGTAVEIVLNCKLMDIMAIDDGHDLRRSAAAEHTARRILQQMKAVRKNPKTPDYDQLDHYMDHVTELVTTARWGKFDKHVADIRKDEAVVMKGERLAREETEAETKKKKGG